MIKDDTVLLERTNPDSLGARYILLGFDSISSVKFIDPIKESIFTTAGFVGKLLAVAAAVGPRIAARKMSQRIAGVADREW